tara:strand:+ start:41 stop:211 length:171 start_codon:yes stop_codon:yes gene_type:complete
MDNIVDFIFNDDSASKISDEIKNALYAKASEKIDALRPVAAASLFDNQPEIETGEE